MAFLSHVVRLVDFLEANTSPLCWACEERKGGHVAVIAIDLHPDIRAHISKRAGSTGILQFDGAIGTPGRAYFKNGRLAEGGISNYGIPDVEVLGVLASSSLARPIMMTLHNFFIQKFGEGYTTRMIAR